MYDMKPYLAEIDRVIEKAPELMDTVQEFIGKRCKGAKE